MSAPKRGRGKGKKTLELINAAVTVLQEIQPATVRAVCYRLFTMGIIPSMEKKHVTAVGRQLVYAREEGIIRWSWIVDETRAAERVPCWSNPEEVLDQARRQYRKDYWEEQDNWVEVWSEKGTVRGTLAPVLKEYGVTFRVMHGFGSATSVYDVASLTRYNEKPLTVLYVGDWDPSGLYMSAVDLPERIARYDGELELKRVALTDADIKGNLPSFEAATKSKDPRYKWFTRSYGWKCWELDALSPVVLRDRVSEKIKELIDGDTWAHCIEVEKAEMESMGGFLDAWNKMKLASKYSGEAKP